MLLYCFEVWSLDFLVSDKYNLEDMYSSFPPVKIQTKFIKHLLGVNKGAVNLAVLSELGITPISIDVLKLSVGFWNHIVSSNKFRLVNQTYKLNYMNVVMLPA